MVNIKLSLRAYEDWLRRELGDEVVEKDLALKHRLMSESPFAFLRATYWRWAETIFEICPELAQAPSVLAVGDMHLENFGTWRDVEGRLVWGVNDFDEAAEMPYALDLVRLVASALLSAPEGNPTAGEIASAVLDGYRHGLRAPRPIVLDRDWAWLRKRVAVGNKARAKFWRRIDKAKYMPAPAPYVEVLAGAMPHPYLHLRTARRTAGAGSLGRPRWIGVAEWQGAPAVREVKAMVPSAWTYAGHGSARGSRCQEIANGRFRANDPLYRLHGRLLVRRLSPNNRKLEIKDADGCDLLVPELLHAMGLDLANLHLGTAGAREAIVRDLEARDGNWLRASARRAVAAVTRDHKDWKKP